MLEIDIPGQRTYKLAHLVLDLNGTLSLDGRLLEGVPERLARLSNTFDILIVTADTFGRAGELGDTLRVKIHKLDPGNEPEQKRELVRQLGSQTTVCIGNGANDTAMLRESALGICVLGPEGTSAAALAGGDVIASDINIALDLLLHPKRLIATLRR